MNTAKLSTPGPISLLTTKDTHPAPRITHPLASCVSLCLCVYPCRDSPVNRTWSGTTTCTRSGITPCSTASCASAPWTTAASTTTAATSTARAPTTTACRWAGTGDTSLSAHCWFRSLADESVPWPRCTYWEWQGEAPFSVFRSLVHAVRQSNSQGFLVVLHLFKPVPFSETRDFSNATALSLLKSDLSLPWNQIFLWHICPLALG